MGTLGVVRPRRQRRWVVGLALALVAATSAPAPAEAAPRAPVLLGSFGDNQGGAADLQSAGHLAIGPNGDLFVIDGALDRVVRFSPTGELIDRWGAEGVGDGEFTSPDSIDVGPDGRVYVVEGFPAARVQVFEQDGTFVRRIGDTGTGDRRLIDPSAVALGPDGNVYVGDFNNATLRVYAPDGTFLRIVHLPPYNQYSSQPHGLAFAPAGDLYILTAGEVVLHYTPEGVLAGVFGGPGSGNGRFQRPRDIDVGPDGHVFVADQGAGNVHEFTAAGTFLRLRGAPGMEEGQLGLPGGVEGAPGGALYVVAFDRVVHLGPDDSVIATWGSHIGDGRLREPTAVAVDPDGDVYVADTGNSRVQVFTAEGEFLRRWGALGTAPGALSAPEGIDVSAAGDVYVADTGNDRVQVFSATGTLLRSWGSPGSGPAQLEGPLGLDVDAAGDVLVVDGGNDRVQVFDRDGALLGTLGSSGTDPGQLRGPHGVAAALTGEVVVTDRLSGQVDVFASDGAFLRRWGTGAGRPRGVDVDAAGIVHVTGTVGIDQYALDGSLRLHWGDDEPFDGPRDIAVTPGGEQFVADDAGDRILRYGPSATAAVEATLVADELDVLPGDAIHYRLTVRNAGDVALTEIVVTDTVAPDCARPLADLAPGESATVDCTRGTDESDLGRVVNVATVDAAEIEPTDSNEVAVDVSHDLDPVLVRSWSVSPTSLIDGDPAGVDAVDVDDDGRVLVAGERGSWPSFAGVHRFDATGTFLDRFVEPDDRTGRRIRGVATGPDGSVYAAACQTFSASDFIPTPGIVERYDADGQFATSWVSPANSFTVGECAPNDVAVAPDGTVYAANRQMDQVQRLEDGGFRAFYGGEGSGPRQLNQPGQLAVAADGSLYITDALNSRVHHVAPDGSRLGYLGEPGPGNGQFQFASGIDIDREGRLYVSESGRLQVFSPTGRFLGRWDRLVAAVHTDRYGNLHLYVDGAEGRIEDHVVPSGPYARVTLRPEVGSAALGATVDYEATVANVGAVPLTGLAFRSEGVPGCALVLPDLAPGEDRTVTCSHTTTAADVGRLRARVVLDADETPQGFASNWTDTEVTPGEVARWGGTGAAAGRLDGARGLAVAGDVFVADCGNDRIQRFTPAGTLVAAWGTPGAGEGELRCPVDVALDVAADVTTVLVLDQQNRRVQRFTPEGTFAAAWDVGAGLAADVLPTSLAVAPDGEVVVTIGDVVRRYRADGTFLAAWAAPTGRGIHATTDHLALSTGNAQGVSIRSRTGAALAGLSRDTVADVTEDGDGFVYVADPTHDVVAKLSPGLQLLGEWPVRDPESVAVDDQGRVYVVSGDEVVVFGGSEAGTTALTGTVTDRVDATAVGGALVGVLHPADLSLVATAVTGAAGEFSVPLAAGTYFVYVIDPSGAHSSRFYGWPHGVEVGEGAATSLGIGLAPATGSLAGTVTEAGGADPVAGAWVLSLDIASRRVERVTIADGSGRYVLEGLAAGDHAVAFVDPAGAHAPAAYTGPGGGSTAVLVGVRGGAATTVDGALAPAEPAAATSHLDGTVTDTAGAGPVPGAGVVALRAADFRFEAATVADAAGRYHLAVPAGAHRLAFLDGSGRLGAEWFDDRPLEHPAGSTPVIAPATTDAALTPVHGSVGGRVTEDGTGLPLAGAWILAVGREGVVGATVAGADGSYELSHLLAGTYRVAFVDPALAHRREFFDDWLAVDAGDPVDVTGGEASVVHAALGAVAPPAP